MWRRAVEKPVVAPVAMMLATALACLGLVACGGSSGGRPSTHADLGGPEGWHAQPRPPASSPGLRQLQRALTRAMAPAGTSTGASVYDLTTGTQLFSLRAGVRRPPASVEKLYTTVAALRLLGPDARLRTSVLGTGHLGPGGTWHGNLYLRGGGDPTFGDDTFHRVYEFGYGASISQLARQLAARGIRRVTGHVIGDASLFDAGRGGPASGLAADIPDFGGQLSALTFDHGLTHGLLSPGAFAAHQLAMTLHALHIRATAAPGTARVPRGAHHLAAVRSPALSDLLRLMNVPSDDLFAEMLTKQLGARYDGRGTISRGAEVISGQIRALGIHPRIVDGSGLSRGDRSSPAQVVTLLRWVLGTRYADVVRRSLPVVGVNGTVRRIGVGTAAHGRCLAKTGTLDNVTNLAGLCHGRRGHTIVFAVFLDGPDNEAALPVLSRTVAALVHYP